MPSKKKKTAVVSKQCVACGCCVKVCPLGAITVPKGVAAVVDAARCVGCGKCAAVCPACVISIAEAAASEPEKAEKEAI